MIYLKLKNTLATNTFKLTVEHLTVEQLVRVWPDLQLKNRKTFPVLSIGVGRGGQGAQAPPN